MLGVIIQQATKVGERKKRKCDRVSPWIERVCDYELRPNVETPATDAFLSEIRAEARNEGLTIPPAVLLLRSITDLSISLCVKFSTLHA